MLPLGGWGGLSAHSGIPKQRIGHHFGWVNARRTLEVRAPAESSETHGAAWSPDVDPVPAGRYFAPFAEVVELVDALRSGRSGRKPVRVRVPPSALKGGRAVVHSRAGGQSG